MEGYLDFCNGQVIYTDILLDQAFDEEEIDLDVIAYAAEGVKMTHPLICE